MANSYSATPAAKPPIQTQGMKASSGLAGSKGKVKAYMDARGAKPISSMNSGEAAKSRRMQNKPQDAQAAGRRRGGVADKAAQFAHSGAVPTGGRGAPASGGIGKIGAQFGNKNPGGVQSTSDRVGDFLKQRAEGGPNGAPQGGPQEPRPSNGGVPRHHPPLPSAGGAPGPRVAPAKPVAKGVGASLGVNTSGPDQKALGAARGAVAKPPVKAGGPGMSALGVSMQRPGGPPQTGLLGAARGAMPKPPTTQPSPPVRGGPQRMPATSNRTAVTGGGNAGGGGAGTAAPGRQRPMNV